MPPSRPPSPRFPGRRAAPGPKSADVGSVVEPAQLEPTPERLGRLSLPPGFEIGVFAENLINPRMLAVADDGTVYVTRRSVGDVMMLRDEDGDGRADVQQTVASRPMMHGVTVDGDTVYPVTISDIYRTTRAADGTLEPLGEPIVDDDLPEGAKQGANDHGSTGWTGMKPPVGDPAHPYHFQVLALDTWLDLPHGASRAALLEALQGHVLSVGDIVGRYARN